MFDKPAPAQHEIHDLIAQRWSTRAFSGQPVDRETLCRLFEAARWAPSSGNGQPWNFIVATKDQSTEFEQLGSVLNPGNAWAKQAPALALSITAMDREPGRPNRHAHHDTGLASENLVIQATALGLRVHMMGGFSPEKATEIFQIPDRFEALTMFVIGYPGDPASLSEDLRQKDLAPRKRKTIGEFVFSGKFGNSAGLE